MRSDRPDSPLPTASPTSAPIALDRLNAAIEERLVGRPMPAGRRLLGIELERLILHRETGESAPLWLCRRVLGEIRDELGVPGYEEGGVLAKLRTERFGISMEPGGQLEFDSDPCPNLQALETVFLEATAAIQRRLAATPYELVDIGHAPVTPVEQLELLPRPRYRIMDASMSTRGELTRNMMRATAGLQMTCDFTDRADAARRLALLNRLVPVLMALTASSRRVAGRDSGYASFRHLAWLHTDCSRVGVPAGTLDVETAIEGYVRFARRAIALFVHGQSGLEPTPAVPFEELAAARPISAADLDLHLTSLFPFVRLRNYLEVRCFDAVCWPLARSVLAMLSGVIYCERATAAAEAISEPLAIRDPGALAELHHAAARTELETEVPGGGTFRELALQLVEFAQGRLGRPDCEFADAADLEAVKARIEDRSRA